MENNIFKLKIEAYENPLKNIRFSVSKWSTLHLHAKIQKHGDMSSYLNYLIDTYSVRIYQGKLRETDSSYLKHQIRAEEQMLLKCQVYESTIIELSELAQIASISRGNLFRLLLDWDINSPRPCYSMVA
jgi:hypothetical protein